MKFISATTNENIDTKPAINLSYNKSGSLIHNDDDKTFAQ